jgi:hypothetical protein
LSQPDFLEQVWIRCINPDPVGKWARDFDAQSGFATIARPPAAR